MECTSNYPRAERCFICRVHHLKIAQEKIFVLDCIKHSEGYLCKCKLEPYHKECLEKWDTFFRGVCPKCLRYRKAKKTSDKEETKCHGEAKSASDKEETKCHGEAKSTPDKEETKCYICGPGGGWNSNKGYSNLDKLRLLKNNPPIGVCACGPISVHPSCIRKWYDETRACPKCMCHLKKQ